MAFDNFFLICPTPHWLYTATCVWSQGKSPQMTPSLMSEVSNTETLPQGWGMASRVNAPTQPIQGVVGHDIDRYIMPDQYLPSCPPDTLF